MSKKCSKHPKYKGKRLFKTKCLQCWNVYEDIHGQKAGIEAIHFMECKYPDREWK